MITTKCICDICGKEVRWPRHPKVVFHSDNRQTILGLESGPYELFGGLDLCEECQERLLEKTRDMITQFCVERRQS